MSRDRTPGWSVLLFAAVAIGVANSVVYGLLGNLQDTYGFGDAGLGLIAGVEGDKVRLSANANVAVTFEEEKQQS